MTKLIFIDVETTGLNPKFAVIHQLAGIIEIDGEVKEKFNYKVKPYGENYSVSDVALEIGGITTKDLFLNKDAKEIFPEFKKLLNKYVDPFNKKDKFIIVGYNCHHFDVPFLREFWNKMNDRYFGSYFYQISVDVMCVLSYLYQDREEIPSFRLEEMAKTFLPADDLAKFKAHDAMSDILVTRDLYYLIEHRRLPCQRITGIQEGIKNRE